MSDTLLELAGIGVPLYSARGLSQTLAPIDAAGHIVRAIDGSLLDLSYAPFQKYKSSLTCEDQEAPAVDGVWPGKLVTVSCVSELCCTGAPTHPAVAGSTRTENGFTFYRPIINMMVLSFHWDTDEYGAKVGWQMDLEEV